MTGKKLLAYTALTVLAMPLMAQKPAETLTYVALHRVKPGKSQAWDDMFVKYFSPLFAKLMAQGVVTGYGLESDMLHQPGTPNSDVWFTMPDYAAFDKVNAAMDKVWAGMSPAEFQLRYEITDPEKHMDYLLRNIVWKTKPVAVGTKPVTSISVYQLQPGKGGDYLKMFEKDEKPVYDKLLAEGVILSYSLDMEEFHSRDSGTRWVVVTVPNLAAFDKVDGAFTALREKATPEERSMRAGQMREIFVPGTHRDYLTESSVYASK